ncbi:hypothetical protein MHBO_002119 [Bonamia ostreae]|uniref:Uncharacterized protein n=1 Tax=Bonamia ostreae TaxID=126728 RepID=A0ABV2ALT7_9EUKA
MVNLKLEKKLKSENEKEFDRFIKIRFDQIVKIEKTDKKQFYRQFLEAIEEVEREYSPHKMYNLLFKFFFAEDFVSQMTKVRFVNKIVNLDLNRFIGHFRREILESDNLEDKKTLSEILTIAETAHLEKLRDKTDLIALLNAKLVSYENFFKIWESIDYLFDELNKKKKEEVLKQLKRYVCRAS